MNTVFSFTFYFILMVLKRTKRSHLDNSLALWQAHLCGTKAVRNGVGSDRNTVTTTLGNPRFAGSFVPRKFLLFSNLNLLCYRLSSLFSVLPITGMKNRYHFSPSTGSSYIRSSSRTISLSCTSCFY